MTDAEIIKVWNGPTSQCNKAKILRFAADLLAAAPVAKPDTVSAPSTGATMIAAERRRQVKEEGWTPEHDAEHGSGSLATAGACYALIAASDLTTQKWWGQQFQAEAQRLWPYDREWWKPKDPLRDLVRAGALIAAEIDKVLATEKEQK